MSMTDTVADLLTQIRNANQANLSSVAILHSKLKEEITKVLKEEGYVKGYEVVGQGAKKNLVVEMKYKVKGERVIEKIVRVSKPGGRVYRSSDKIKPVRGGLGIAIFSTPKGVLSDESARKQNVGGEWLCSVW